MKKVRFDFSVGVSSSPGNHIGEIPEALITALRDLLPELLTYKELTDKMNSYLFSRHESGLSELFREICGKMEDIVPLEKRESLDLLITLLEGIRSSVEENHFTSADDLNEYLENNKQNFKETHWELFVDPDGQNQDYHEKFEKPGMGALGSASQKRK